MIKKGYREIYFIYSNPYSSPNKDRIRGIKKALKDNDISLDKIKMIHCWRDVDLYYGATQKEIDYKGEKIGIHVWDDQMALGVCRAIMDKGLKIPDEVGIVGYDDIPTSKHLLIPLTTIMNPAYEIGAKASEILIDKIEKKTPLEEAKQIILKPELKIRG
ncbi:substrate-binding domain-containing protein, partial [bacterium]|nr:substrate-binding domain-containing protein [bacterium]